MGWLTNSAQARMPAPDEKAIKHTFDVPVKMQVRGVQEQVQATLLHIALSGARLRSWISLERGAGLSFQWRLSSGKLLTLNGVVAARYAPRNGGVGFEYAVALEALPQADGDELSREAAMLARRTASARNYDTSVIDISQFTGYRVPDSFSVHYRISNVVGAPKSAQACDVTGNGLRLVCAQPLETGAVALLQFTLPDHVLAVHKGKDDELVIGPMGYRRVPRKTLRRPFPPLSMRAQVVGAIDDPRRGKLYEVQFLNVDGLAREELARYIHASQLAKVSS